MTHNPVFERFIADTDDPVRAYVAYGIYKQAKREWILEYQATHDGASPTPTQLDAYVSTWTPQLIRNAVDAAESTLAEFAASAIRDARPGIVEEALKGNWLKSVLLSMLAAFLYTLLLIGIVLILQRAGVDLLSIASSGGTSGTGQPQSLSR